VMPSDRYSICGSVTALAKGSTAIELMGAPRESSHPQRSHRQPRMPPVSATASVASAMALRSGDRMSRVMKNEILDVARAGASAVSIIGGAPAPEKPKPRGGRDRLLNSRVE